MIIDFDSKNKGGGKEPVVETLNVTANGSYNAPSGVDGYNPVEVNVPQREPVLEALSVTDNGTYTPSSGVDGYNSVDVNVPKEIHNVTSKSITENGVYNSDGNDVWNEVSVNVPQKTFNKTSLTKEYTENGQYSIATPDGYDGISDVNLTVAVPERQPVLESLSVTENGIYNAPSNIDGYNTVSVNVPQSGGTGFDLSQLRMVKFSGNLQTIDLSGFDTSNFDDMSEMFRNCSSLTSLDLSTLNTANVTDMSNMFYDCGKLTSLDLSSFDTSKVTDIGGMFNSCRSLTSLDLSSFNTSNVTNIGGMFSWCEKLTSLNLSSFNTSNVTDMGIMFYNCSALKSLDLSYFDTSKVTNMGSMFYNCSALTTLDISGWSFEKYASWSSFSLFEWCTSLETIISDGLQLPDKDLSYTGLNSCKQLTVDSIVGLLNALPTTTNGYSFQIGQTNIDKLSDDQKAIATSKGWQLV